MTRTVFENGTYLTCCSAQASEPTHELLRITVVCCVRVPELPAVCECSMLSDTYRPRRYLRLPAAPAAGKNPKHTTGITQYDSDEIEATEADAAAALAALS